MEFLDLAKRRASVRAYQKRSVERAVLEQVLEDPKLNEKEALLEWYFNPNKEDPA